jgi:putative selenate reductase
MDAARTARRLTGQPVTVVYRRSRAEMPAEEEELRDLFDEGNELIELASPQRVILKGGRVAALECVRNELGEPGADGRRKPVRVTGSEFQIEADSIIVAVGQRPDIAFLDSSGVARRSDGSIVTDPESGRIQDHVYAGGDVARGPAIIVQACADGRRAAEAICRQIGVEFVPPAVPTPRLSQENLLQVKQARARKEAPHEPEMLPVAQRGGFDLVEQTLTEEAAQAEAARCLQCSMVCDKCVEVCPNRANYTYRVEPVHWTLPVLACRDGALAVVGEEVFQVTQTRQIVHVDDFCNECGNCATFCVHQGKPYADKPRLFLQEADFQLEDDNAFYVENDRIRRREGGREASLTAQNGALTFENSLVRLGLSPEFEVMEMTLKERFEGTLSLREAAEMGVLGRGIRDSLPFLARCS